MMIGGERRESDWGFWRLMKFDLVMDPRLGFEGGDEARVSYEQRSHR